MTTGHQVEPGELHACGRSFTEEGAGLVQASAAVETHVGPGSIGRAWPEFAPAYQAGFERIRDAVEGFGISSVQFGGALRNAAIDYDRTDTAAGEDFEAQGC